MDPQRKVWNDQHKQLRQALAQPGLLSKAIELFLGLHGMVHASEMSHSRIPSFEDGLWEGLSDTAVRNIPDQNTHPLVWIIWHLARIEDVTMNLLVAGSPQVISQENWHMKMKATVLNTGNGMDAKAIAGLSASIDVKALRSYRLAVGRRTRDIVQALDPGQVQQKTSPDRLQQVVNQGALLDTAQGLLDYWGGLTIAGLLLMPPTRHNLVHLNEAWRNRAKYLHILKHR